MVAVAVVAVITAVVVLVPGQRGPSHPDQWDPRVTELVAFVERRSGGPFDHPVTVDFLPEEEFKRVATGEAEGPPTDDERREAERSAGALRALGLIGGDVDLLAERSELSGEGTAAIYRPEEKRVIVRGTDLDLLAEATLVHELTHAWQDQRFDLSRIYDFETSQEADGFRAVAEGDAENAEDAWVEELPPTERERYEQASDDRNRDAEQQTGDAPGILIASFIAPYELGQPFMTFLEADGGAGAVRGAFDRPPASEEQLMDPWRYLDGDAVRTVEVPGTSAETDEDEGQYGALFWYLLLAEHIDPLEALRAADGWAGDAYVLEDRDGKVCVRARVEADTGRDTDELADALEAWDAAVPTATVRRDGESIDLDACDPGKGSAIDVPDRTMQTIGYPIIRLLVWSSSRAAGESRERSRCLGEAFVERLTLDELSADEPLPADRLAQLRADAAAAC